MKEGEIESILVQDLIYHGFPEGWDDEDISIFPEFAVVTVFGERVIVEAWQWIIKTGNNYDIWEDSQPGPDILEN